MNSFLKGKNSEKYAIDFIKNKKYTLVEKNYRSIYGEIDIIALHCNSIIFIEVKSSQYWESLDFSINVNKKRKILKTAEYFLFKNRRYKKYKLKFEIIFIKYPEGLIKHFEKEFFDIQGIQQYQKKSRRI